MVRAGRAINNHHWCGSSFWWRRFTHHQTSASLRRGRRAGGHLPGFYTLVSGACSPTEVCSLLLFCKIQTQTQEQVDKGWETEPRWQEVEKTHERILYHIISYTETSFSLTAAPDITARIQFFSQTHKKQFGQNINHKTVRWRCWTVSSGSPMKHWSHPAELTGWLIWLILGTLVPNSYLVYVTWLKAWSPLIRRVNKHFYNLI